MHREAITHSQLHHPNILPFLGIFHENEGSTSPLVILPFIEKGSLNEMLVSDEVIGGSTFSRIVSEHFELIFKCPSAYQCTDYRNSSWDSISSFAKSSRYTRRYSSSEFILSRQHVRYSLKWFKGNVLLSPSGDAIICDFGLSRIRHEVTRTQTMLQEGGHLRFLAPELSDGIAEKFRTSQESDIFSLSMTFLNAWTRRPPFHELKNDLQVAAEFRRDRRPTRPTVSTQLSGIVEEKLWTLLGKMWAGASITRPSSTTVREEIEALLRPWLQPESIMTPS